MPASFINKLFGIMRNAKRHFKKKEKAPKEPKEPAEEEKKWAHMLIKTWAV